MNLISFVFLSLIVSGTWANPAKCRKKGALRVCGAEYHGEWEQCLKHLETNNCYKDHCIQSFVTCKLDG